MSLFAFGLVLLSATLHATWNLLVRDQRATNMFINITLVALVGFLPLILLAEFFAPPVLTAVPINIGLGGIFLVIYYFGLYRSYTGGDFTVAYPLARGLPVLLVACAEAAFGDAPTLFGWLGIILIAVGSIFIPLQSLRELRVARYWNRTTIWILLASLGIAATTLIDANGLRQLPNGWLYAVRYTIWESIIGGVLYWLLLRARGEPITIPSRLGDWKLSILATLFVFGSYSLILWAFQSDERASYVIGLRQISIVIGVVAGAYLFHERGARLRIPAALVITLGVILLSIA